MESHGKFLGQKCGNPDDLTWVGAWCVRCCTCVRGGGGRGMQDSVSSRHPAGVLLHHIDLLPMHQHIAIVTYCSCRRCWMILYALTDRALLFYIICLYCCMYVVHNVTRLYVSGWLDTRSTITWFHGLVSTQETWILVLPVDWSGQRFAAGAARNSRYGKWRWRGRSS